jgi:hypothetical protein
MLASGSPSLQALLDEPNLIPELKKNSPFLAQSLFKAKDLPTQIVRAMLDTDYRLQDPRVQKLPFQCFELLDT